MKKYIVILIAFLLVLSAGCEKEEAEKEGTTPGVASPFIGGTEGLAVTFQSGAPPSEVYDLDFEFDINVRIENMGEQDVDAGEAELRITGINPADFGGVTLEDTIDDELIARKKDPMGNQIQGGITNVNFERLQAEKVAGEVVFNIRAEVCYPYQTRAISQLCVLEDLLGKTRKAGETPFCDPNAAQVSPSSAGPLAIENFKQSVIGENKISFTFDVAHKGKGMIYKQDQSCEATIANKNKVTIDVDSGTLGTLSCSGLANGNNGEITLFGDLGLEKRTIVCTQTITDPGDYTSPVTITIDYDYKSIADLPNGIKVKHIEE